MRKYTKEECTAINLFLTEQQDRIARMPTAMPFKAVEGNLVLNWLRARVGAAMDEA
jgi:hypothetical protein